MILLNFLLQAAPTDTIASAANAATDAATQATVIQDTSYLDFLLKGGIMIYPLILLLFFCIYVIIERYLFIKKATQLDTNLVNDIKTQLRAGRLDNAIMVASRDTSAAGNVMKSGVTIIGRPIPEIESVMERTTEVEVGSMEKGLGYLGLISGIAPILGFIGTISGVIRIFYSISNTGNLNIQVISGGLYEKMISSGAGLVVGVVAYSGYHLFNMVIDKFVLKIQRQILDIIHIIQDPQNGN